MQINAISAVKANNTTFQAKKTNHKQSSDTQQSNPQKMVKVPYNALMGLMMLASTAMVGCSKGGGADEPIDPWKPDTTVVTPPVDTVTTSNHPVKKAMTNMLNTLGILQVTKSYSPLEGDITNYSYHDGWKGGTISATLDKENSTESELVYKESELSDAFTDYPETANITTIKFKVLDDGRLMKTTETGLTHIYKNNGDKIVRTTLFQGSEDYPATFTEGNTPNTVDMKTYNGKSYTIENINVETQE